MAGFGDSVYGVTPYAGDGGDSGTTVALGIATEADTTLALTVTVGARVNLGLASESDSALAVTIVSGVIIPLGIATETDTARPVTFGQISLGIASESDSALGVSATVGKVVQLGLAAEADSAFPVNLTAPSTISLGYAVETGVAFGVTLTYSYALTVTNNRAGGRVRGGIGTASWEPAVDPSPVALGLTLPVAQAFDNITVDGTQPHYDVTTTYGTQTRDRVIVGGKDVTWFRGIKTPLPAFQYVEPLLYGAATLTLPQINPEVERLGVGALKWLRPGRKVLVQRVNDAGTVVATDYKGIVVAFDIAGGDLTVQIGGEASGRAALRNKQLPIFQNRRDAGRLAFRAIHDLGLSFKPFLGPTTGIKLSKMGGTSHLEHIQRVCSMSATRAGNQWSIMPNANGVYRFARKDTTTIHGTVYLDKQRTVGNLRRDIAEEPNRIYGTGVEPDGQRFNGAVYPGLKQGEAPSFPGALSEGDSGESVRLLINRLQTTRYLDRRDFPGGFDADVTKAVKDAQDAFNLPETGVVNLATWRRLWDLDKTGSSVDWSHIEPLAQTTKTRKWDRTGSGAPVSRNPGYDRTVLPVDRNIDFGPDFLESEAREFARDQIARNGGSNNWVGTVVFNTGGLVAGEHTPGDPFTVMAARDLRAGMNLSLPTFQGGITVHVSGVSVDTNGTVTATVDTQARDTMPAWEVIKRNRESRKDPARLWIQQHTSSGEMKDSIGPWDKVGGILYNDITVPGGKWTVFPVIAGQEGTIASLRVRTTPDAEFTVAVFGRNPGDSLAARLERRIGNPLTDAGYKKWSDESVRDALDERFLLLYAAGEPDLPCGYHPGRKDDETPTLTGAWYDDAGFGYRTFSHPELYVAVYADRDTVIPAGRIMRVQLEAGA